MCSPSVLLVFGLHSHLGSLCPLPHSSMLVDTSCLKGTCSPRVTFPQLRFYWVCTLRVCGRSIWLSPCLPGEKLCTTAQQFRARIFFFRVPLHPNPSACIRWVVGDHSCPLWQTADKFGWVRPSGGGGGWGQGQRVQVGRGEGERLGRAERGVGCSRKEVRRERRSGKGIRRGGEGER